MFKRTIEFLNGYEQGLRLCNQTANYPNEETRACNNPATNPGNVNSRAPDALLLTKYQAARSMPPNPQTKNHATANHVRDPRNPLQELHPPIPNPRRPQIHPMDHPPSRPHASLHPRLRARLHAGRLPPLVPAVHAHSHAALHTPRALHRAALLRAWLPPPRSRHGGRVGRASARPGRSAGCEGLRGDAGVGEGYLSRGVRADEGGLVKGAGW